MTSNSTYFGPKPIIKPPTEIRLRGACGPGFGRGQLLARMHLKDQKAKLVVERAFLPNTIQNNFTTHPFAWQTRPFEPESKDFKNWTYVIVEVGFDSVSPAVFHVENLDGSFVQDGWRALDLQLLALDEETGYRLAILTGLQYRKQNVRPHKGSYVKNFADADRIDTLGWRPKLKPRPDADEVDPNFQSPAKAERLVSSDHVTVGGPDKSGVIAFIARSFQGEKCDVLVKRSAQPLEEKAPAAAAPKPRSPDARPRQQPKQDGRPNRPPTPLNRGFASALRGFKVE